jgi:phosphoribosylglycinamide formyltransferase-1
MTVRIAVLASGTGSNAAALADAIENGILHATLACVVCDVPGALVVERMRARRVPVLEIDANGFPDRDAYEREVLRQLNRHAVDWVVLAGYLRICGNVFLDRWLGRCINLHPSLLPAFPGRRAIRDALNAGAARTGVTVHLVDHGVDTGPVLAQQAVPVLPYDTEHTLAARIHAVEHSLLPETVERVISNRIDIPNLEPAGAIA